MKCWQNCAKYQKSIDANLIRLIGRRREGGGWICSVDVDTGNKMFHRIPGYESIVIVKQRNSSICLWRSISGVPRETKILKVT